MGSPLSLFACIWTMNRPLTRPSTFVKPTADKSGTLSPNGGEGWGEGVRFMGREHLPNSDVNRSHEPGRRLQSGTGFQPVSPEQARCLCHFLRFMEREHLQKLDVS